MLTPYNKSNSVLKCCKKACLFFLLLSPAATHAQNDTLVMADTLPYQMQPDPTEDIPPAQESDDAAGQNYFLKKWEHPLTVTIVQRTVPDSLVKKMQQDDDFWYANADIKEEEKPQIKEPDYQPIAQQQWFQTLLWIVIIGGFAAVIMWYLAGSNVGLFRRKNKLLAATGAEEPETEDIFAINYQKEIDKAEAAGNYRLAIRLKFLRLLKSMAEKNVIRYKQDRTNHDYLLQLDQTTYYNNFFRITRSYEYSWYGQFDVAERAYRIISSDFSEFEQKLQ